MFQRISDGTKQLIRGIKTLLQSSTWLNRSWLNQQHSKVRESFNSKKWAVIVSFTFKLLSSLISKWCSVRTRWQWCAHSAINKHCLEYITKAAGWLILWRQFFVWWGESKFYRFLIFFSNKNSFVLVGAHVLLYRIVPTVSKMPSTNARNATHT